MWGGFEQCMLLIRKLLCSCLGRDFKNAMPPRKWLKVPYLSTWVTFHVYLQRIMWNSGSCRPAHGDTVLAAKGDAYLPGLAYLDTPCGINYIVEKFPTNLWEKWRFTGSHFKEENKVSFSPFLFFTHFVCSEAKARNDSIFKFSNSSHAVIRNERPVYKHGASSVPVSVHKTRCI